MATGQLITREHMNRGVDEDDQRVKMFTSALTSERAIKCGVGAFQYNGATITLTAADHNRMCARCSERGMLCPYYRCTAHWGSMH